jgi:Tfp pilus assembly protein PilN
MADKLIHINLSEEYESWQRKQKPRTPLPIFVGIPLFVIILSYAIFYVSVYIRSERLNDMTQKYEQLKEPEEESTRIEKLNAKLKERAAVVQACQTSWISWSDRWLEIARIIPDKVYLTSLEIRKALPTSDLLLRMEGRAFGVADETAILRFHQKLKLNPLFSNEFSAVNLVSVTTEGSDKVFTIELRKAAKKK